MKLDCNHPRSLWHWAELIGLDTMLAVVQAFHKGAGDPGTGLRHC
jgi:3-hydroxybutyryl-CoA dehydrogenase